MNKILKRTLALVLSLLMVFGITAFSAETTGELVAKLYWTDNAEDGIWTDVQAENAAAVFNVSGFEPGSEVIRYLKVENGGNLAFSYDLKMVADEIGELANVIDVYFKKDNNCNMLCNNFNMLGGYNNCRKFCCKNKK